MPDKCVWVWSDTHTLIEPWGLCIVFSQWKMFSIYCLTVDLLCEKWCVVTAGCVYVGDEERSRKWDVNVMKLLSIWVTPVYSSFLQFSYLFGLKSYYIFVPAIPPSVILCSRGLYMQRSEQIGVDSQNRAHCGMWHSLHSKMNFIRLSAQPKKAREIIKDRRFLFFFLFLGGINARDVRNGIWGMWMWTWPGVCYMGLGVAFIPLQFCWKHWC